MMEPLEERGDAMIYLNRQSNEPLYAQIYDQIKEEILTGALKEDDLLTGSRAILRRF